MHHLPYVSLHTGGMQHRREGLTASGRGITCGICPSVVCFLPGLDTLRNSWYHLFGCLHAIYSVWGLGRLGTSPDRIRIGETNCSSLVFMYLGHSTSMFLMV